ncbi:DNA-processing protein DprA [Patescibacteria group bacterium]
MSTQDLAYQIAFSKIPFLGSRQLTRLHKYFGDFNRAWNSNEFELVRAGLLPKTIRAILEHRSTIEPERELEHVYKEHIKVVTLNDDDYPRLLKEISDPPHLLYYRGTISEYQPTIAIVGTRKTTSYGREVARWLSSEIAKLGICVVSGLALGIDAIAHQSALEVQGATIAVLGSGLDQIYPQANSRLAQSIISSGALVSEFPLGTHAQKHHFPIRNRIIAGLSLGVIVIEGSNDSGSLITAKVALDYNREVLAVPGDIFRKTSEGTNKLIKLGAHPVASVQDVLGAFNLEKLEQKSASGLDTFSDSSLDSESDSVSTLRNRRVDNISDFDNNQQHTRLSNEERIIISLLTREPRHIDEIVKLSKLQTNIINAALTTMELRGLIRHLGGMNYIRIL